MELSVKTQKLKGFSPSSLAYQRRRGHRVWPIMAIVNANDNDDHNGGTEADELYRSE